MSKRIFAVIVVLTSTACGSKPSKTTTPAGRMEGTPLPAADRKGRATEPDTTAIAPKQEQPAGSFDPIYFDYDLSELRQEARDELVELSRYLTRNAGTRLTIYGHADERGTPEYNIALGLDRAKAARAYLVRLGVEEGRITIKSYGEERPVAEGEDEAAWAKNRRDEFQIIDDARAGAQ